MRDEMKRLFFLATAVFWVCTTVVEARKLNVSDPMPEFSVVDAEQVEFSCPGAANEVLLVAFLSPSKPQSLKALSDLERMFDSVGESPNRLSVLIVLDDPNAVSALPMKVGSSNAPIEKHIIVDLNYKLWGTFGAIASPTVFLAGTDHKIMLIKAGYGYDFGPAIKSKLLMALGITSEDTFDSNDGVKTARNDASAAKVARHLKMAKMLEQKQKYDSALKQLELAVEIDPNSIESRLELGHMYCLVSEGQKAIKIVEGLTPEKEEQQSVRCFILGKGYFLLEEYDSAEKFLLESLKLNARNSEAYYLLGRMYHIQNKQEKAVEAYYESLRLLYGRD